MNIKQLLKDFTEKLVREMANEKYQVENEYKLKPKIKMAETKKITTLYVVTDSETSYDNIGDIDGGLFPDGFLKKHIKAHGAEGLLEKLASMTSAVITAKYDIARKESERDGQKFTSVPQANDNIPLVVFSDERAEVCCDTCKYCCAKGKCNHPQGCEGDYELWEQ